MTSIPALPAPQQHLTASGTENRGKAECAVIGTPDPERGAIVEAHVGLAEGHSPSDELTRALQEHVKANIAPFKYPRSVIFTKGLPKTESGKIQRFRLRPGRDDTQDQTGRNQKGDMT